MRKSDSKIQKELLIIIDEVIMKHKGNSAFTLKRKDSEKSMAFQRQINDERVKEIASYVRTLDDGFFNGTFYFNSHQDKPSTIHTLGVEAVAGKIK